MGFCGGNDFPHTPSIQKAARIRTSSDTSGLLFGENALLRFSHFHYSPTTHSGNHYNRLIRIDYLFHIFQKITHSTSSLL